MSVAKAIHAAATRNMRGGQKRSAVNPISVTTFGVDMDRLTDNLTGSQLLQASKRMSKILRDETVRLLKVGSSASRVGRSQYDLRTRGKWRSPSVTKYGVNYLKGGWWGEVLDRRGANKKTMAYNGGDTKSGGGNRGIITNTQNRRGKGWYSATGPRYGTDDKDESRFGYNYAHMLEYGGTHKAWNKPAPALRARPFLNPAAAIAYTKQNALLKQMLLKWGKFG